MSNRYLRSVNIAHDLSTTGHELAGYMATPLVWQTLQRIAEGSVDASRGRAFSIIGPYGTGKSAFGVFLAHWMAANAESRAVLWQTHTTVPSHSTRADTPRLYPVPLQVKTTTLRQAIVATLVQIVAAHDPHHVLVVALSADASQPDIPPETVAKHVADVAAFIKHHSDYTGILLIIDELGQHLAHIHRAGDTRDLFVLQTIAETAARSGDTPVVVVTILHQTFERYNTTASVAQQTEWAKVQGRYVDLIFQEPQTQMMRFVAQVVRGLYPAKRSATDKARIDQWAIRSRMLGLQSPEFKDREWRGIIDACYPLHPTVVVALPILFRILAQNERSLFAFLTAQERGSLSEFLTKYPAGSGAVYRLADLFAYVEQTLGPGLFGRARGRPWVELSETVQRLRNTSPIALTMLVTVGVLAALKDDAALRPSRDMLAWAVDAEGTARFNEELATLVRQQVLVYSAYRDRYRLAEASDINLDDKIQHARSQLAGQRDIVALLSTYTTLDPIIAYRHTYYSGTLRHFVVRFVSAQWALEHSTAQHSTAQHSTAQHSTAQHSTAQHDGEIWYVVVADDDELTSVIASPRSDVVLVFPERVVQLRDAVLDVAAHHAVHDDRDITQDRVAQRELALRRHEAQHTLNQLVEASYGPGYGQWYVAGQRVDVRDRRTFDTVVSQVFDTQYAAAPRIRSELIVRRKLSGAISRARRQLIARLLDYSHMAYLDFGDGYPPERAIYDSLLLASGLHAPRGDGTWHVTVPDAAHDPLNVVPVCMAIDAFFDASIAARRPLSELYTILHAPPYGLREPLIPLFFVVMYLMHSGEVAIYEHDSFVASPDEALFERLVAKPQHFAIRRSPTSALRVALFERVARAFAPQALGKRGTMAVLDAVKPMLRYVHNLPAYARTTQALSPTTIAVRQVILDAKAPDDLLYIQIPMALGLPAIAGDAPLDDSMVEAIARGLRGALEELQAAYPRLRIQCEHDMADAVLAQQRATAPLYDELQARMQLVVRDSADPQLRALANRITHADSTNWIEPVAALLGRKPLTSWSDADVGVYRLAVADAGRRLRLLEQVATAHTQHHLGQRRRVGVSDAKGERSVVVTPVRDALYAQLTQLFAQAGMDTGQQLGVLAALLEDRLPDDTTEESHDA